MVIILLIFQMSISAWRRRLLSSQVAKSPSYTPMVLQLCPVPSQLTPRGETSYSGKFCQKSVWLVVVNHSDNPHTHTVMMECTFQFKKAS